MTNPIARGMARATDLTRAGNLTEATALIQSLLQGQPAGQQPDGVADAIEGTFRRMDQPQTDPQPHKAQASRPKDRPDFAATLRAFGAGAGSVAPVPLPDGASFLALTHQGAQGTRAYRLYIPARRPAGPMPLIVMLHGCTQSPEDFAKGTDMNALAEEFGCLVAYPAQCQGANAQKCWNWFRPEDQARGLGEPALIAGIVGDILRDHPTDAARVYVAGLSAGGAAAAIMGAAYPDIFAAVGVHSGLPVGGARDMPSAFAAMRSGAAGTPQQVAVPTIVFHGLADSTVHPGNGNAVVAQVVTARPGLREARMSEKTTGGRAYARTLHEDTDGRSIAEHWEIAGAGHAWAGGQQGGSYTDPKGPDASREMVRFFLQHRQKDNGG